MVLMIEPIDRCISKLKEARTYDEIIYLSPDGELLQQGIANELSLKKNLIMLCGHYKGVDEGSEIQYTGKVHAGAGESRRLAPPRRPPPKGLRAKTFGRLRALTGADDR